MKSDLIFSLNRSEICCIATRIGWLYGIRSDSDHRYGCGGCEISFIDIDFKNPDCKLHDELVMRFKPKYATVLDITEESMVSDAIVTASWYDGHGIKPIVIPKIDCIHRIPKCFTLGYSVPTKYGATEIPVECFADRNIHLLGGTPKRQLSYYRRFLELGCEVTSMDGNCINKAAVMGSVFDETDTREWINKYPHGGHWQECLRESLRNVWNFWQECFEDLERGQMSMCD
jgi:hypothetical protein